MSFLGAYLPQDRYQALARGEPLAVKTDGSALFADISGFTPLTEKLTRELGSRRGAEELTLKMARELLNEMEFSGSWKDGEMLTVDDALDLVSKD